MSTYRYLSHTVPHEAPLSWLDHRGEEFDVSRVSWDVTVPELARRPLVMTVLHGTDRDGAQTNATEYADYTATGSPLWHEYAPQPPAWFHAAAAAFIRDHDPDRPQPVSSQAGLSTIRHTPGGAA